MRCTCGGVLTNGRDLAQVDARGVEARALALVDGDRPCKLARQLQAAAHASPSACAAELMRLQHHVLSHA